MIRFIPIASLVNAKLLSKRIWELAVLTVQPGATQDVFGTITDLQGGIWLVCPDDYRINIHQDAVLGGLETILTPLVQQGNVTAEEITALRAKVNENRGSTVIAFDLLPAYFKNKSKTITELKTLNLIAQAP